jgi:hypothetical protein
MKKKLRHIKSKLRVPKVKVAHLKHPVKQLKDRRAKKDEVTSPAVVPLITSETIAEHREEVLSSARKYIYPLQHSKHRIVLISTSIFLITAISLFVYGYLALYKLQTTSTFVYRISQVVPFPVARTEKGYVSYESYLFELRHYMHYYEVQQKQSFKTTEGKKELSDYKKRSLDRVVNDAYVKQLAEEHKVSVTNQEIDTEIDIVREQNRLGSSNQVFEDVLRDFWGWSLSDFKRSLRQQLLARKVVSKMDEGAHARAQAALNELKAGTPFDQVARKYSDDAGTKDAGGEIPGPIDKSSRDFAAQTTAAIFDLKVGEYSKIVDTGYGLEIVRLNAYEGDKARASHIQITFKDIGTYINELKDKEKAKLYINV